MRLGVDPQRTAIGVTQVRQSSVARRQRRLKQVFHSAEAGVLEPHHPDDPSPDFAVWIVTHQVCLQPDARQVRLADRLRLPIVQLVVDDDVPSPGPCENPLIDLNRISVDHLGNVHRDRLCIAHDRWIDEQTIGDGARGQNAVTCVQQVASLGQFRKARQARRHSLGKLRIRSQLHLTYTDEQQPETDDHGEDDKLRPRHRAIRLV